MESAGKESACNVGDLHLIPGLGRSSGKGEGYPFQYSGHGVAKSRTQLTGFLFHFFYFLYILVTIGIFSGYQSRKIFKFIETF